MTSTAKASVVLTLLLFFVSREARSATPKALVRNAQAHTAFRLELRAVQLLGLADARPLAVTGVRGTVKTIATSPVNPVASAYDADDGDLYVLTSFNPLIPQSTTAILQIGPSGEVRPFVSLPAGTANAIAYDRATRTFYVSTFDSATALPALLAVSSTGTSVLAGGAGSGTADGKGAAATFAFPSGIAVDDRDGALYVYDFDRIRRVTTRGVVTTLTKPGAFQVGTYGSSVGLAYDPVDRNLYVANPIYELIERVSPASGSVVTFAGRCDTHVSPGIDGCDQLQRDGIGTRALFAAPSALAADPSDGALYVTDSGNNAVRRIDLEANVTTLAGNGIAANRDGAGSNATFDGPTAISYDSRGRRLDVTDFEQFPPSGPAAAVRTVTTTGAAPPPPNTPITLFDTPSLDARPFAIDWRRAKPNAQTLVYSEEIGRFGEITVGGANYEQIDPLTRNVPPYGPFDTVYGADGSSWFLDAQDRQLDHRSVSGKVDVIRLGSRITSAPSVDQLTLGPDGNVWFALTTDTSTVVGTVTPSGTLKEHTFAAFFGGTTSLAFQADGKLWISNGSDLIELDGFAHVLVDDAYPANYLTRGPDGNVWFTTSDAIGTVRPNNTIVSYPIRAPIATCPGCSRGIAAITTGSDGALWFVEQGQGEIGRLAPGGALNEFPVPAARSVPNDITTGPDGNIWFVDAGAQKIGRLSIR